MKMGQELMECMGEYPDYLPEVREKSSAERLIALSDIYDIYIPSQMSVEIYHKLYMGLMRSLQKKSSIEAVHQQYENCKGRSLRKYCKDEAVDYDWLIEFKKSYRSNKLQPDENKKLGEGEFIALTVEENFVPEQQTPAGWQVERLILKSPTGDEMEIKCTNLFAVAELLRKMS